MAPRSSMSVRQPGLVDCAIKLPVRASGDGMLVEEGGGSLSISWRPQRRQRDEPELIAERRDLITQIEHNSGAELLAEFIPERLERSTNLLAKPPFSLLAPNLSGQLGTTTYTDTNAAPLGPLFYRVGVGQ